MVWGKSFDREAISLTSVLIGVIPGGIFVSKEDHCGGGKRKSRLAQIIRHHSTEFVEKHVLLKIDVTQTRERTQHGFVVESCLSNLPTAPAQAAGSGFQNLQAGPKPS
jgi:hypothetical protein